MEQFHAKGGALVLMWYGMVVVSILFIPLGVFIHQILVGENSRILNLATVFGLLAALTNILGFVRWVFIVPHLASTYVDPASSETTRDATMVAFDVFHLYAGYSIGEHLGFIFTGIWVGLLGLAMAQSAIIKPWIGYLGVASALLIMFGSLEAAGIQAAADVNVIGFLIWSVWLILVGVFLIRVK